MKNKWLQMVKITLLLICLAVPATLFMLPTQEVKATLLQEAVYEEGYTGDIVDLVRVKKAEAGTDLDGDGKDGGAEDLRQMRYFLVGKVDKFYKTMGIAYGYNTGDEETPNKEACYYVADDSGFAGTSVAVLSAYNDGEHGEMAVSYVGNSAFSGNTTITKVELPESVKVLRGWSFFGCTNLETVIMPGVQRLWRGTNYEGVGRLVEYRNFASCTALKTVVVANNFWLGDEQFTHGAGNNTPCTGAHVQLYVSGQQLYPSTENNYQYNSCLKKTVYYHDPNAVHGDNIWKYDQDGNVKLHTYVDGKCSTCGVYDAKGIVYGYNPGDQETNNEPCYYVADNTAYTGTTVEVLSTYNDGEHGELPVAYVAQFAFNGNANIKKVVLPESVKVLRGWSFFGCTNLETVIMPGVQRLWRGTSYEGVGRLVEYRNFASCTALKTVVVANNFWLGDEQFTHGAGNNTPCTGAHVQLYVSGQQLYPSTEGNYQYSSCLKKTVYYHDPNAVHGDNTWKYDQDGNVELMMHTYVDDKCSTCGAYDTKGIVYGYNPGDAETNNEPCYYVADNSAYTGTTVEVLSTYNDGEHGELPVAYVAQNAFANNTNIQTVRLPESVKVLRGWSFIGCTNLETVIMPGVQKLWRGTSYEGVGRLVEYRNFAFCTALKTVVVDENFILADEHFKYGTNYSTLCTDAHVQLYVDGGYYSRIESTANPCLKSEVYYYDPNGTSGTWHYDENGNVVVTE